MRFYDGVIERLYERIKYDVNVGRIGAAGATVVQTIHFIDARNFLVPYIFMREIEAKGFKHLFFRETDGAFIELVSENKDGVRMVARIFLNDARNVRINVVVRRLA